MLGKPKRKRLSAAATCLLLAVLSFSLLSTPAAANELRRHMPFIRALLMGDAQIAVGDEAGAWLYNPAALARLQEGSAEIFAIQYSADRELTRLLLEPDEVQSEYDNLSPAGLQAKLGQQLFSDVQIWVPAVVSTESGQAFALGVNTLGAAQVIEDPLGLPGLNLEAFIEESALWSGFKQIQNVSLGVTGKAILRGGINKAIDATTLFASGSLDLENDPDWQALLAGETRTRYGVDLGLIYEIPGFRNWRPRFGISALNLGGQDGDRDEPGGVFGIEFSKPPDKFTPPLFGRYPLNVGVGFAVSPTFHGVRYTAALDMVDVTKTALDGDSLNLRTRLGLEIGVGPHKDGTALFSLLMGLNATHFSAGILARVWIFEIGFGRYAVEIGDDAGDDPQERRVLLIGVRI